METLVRKHFSPASLGARALICVLGSSLGTVAVGQETVPDEPDPPERIARLSYTQGGVTLQAVGETAWAPAPVNRPMVTGDYLRTDAGGRAELQMDEATVRMGAGTDFTFIALEDRALRMRMSAGVVYLRVRNLGENDVIEVETPQATAAILRPGNYRLEVSETVGATVLKVSSGMMEARGAGQSVVVRAQQTATLTGSAGRFAYTTGTLGAPDSFDEWSLERDLRMDNSLATESSRYVSEDVVGYEDLDTYGEWRSEPEYGYVWSPRVVSGWSPYRFGRYTWVGGWGWTWIADEPWGFAPFHYGNWVTIGGRWCWVPGPRHGRPIGRPGRPGDGRHDWHIPTPPRGVATRAGVRGDADRDGTRPSFRADRDNEAGGATWVDREQGRASGSRWRTMPDGNRDRYVRPDQPQQAGSPGTAAGTPPAAAPTGEDRRIRIPRNEIPRSDLPRNTFPRDDSRMRNGGDAVRVPQPRAEMPRREMPRQEAPRPSPPPQQQQSTRQEMPRGGRDRDPPAGGGRPGSDRR
jgi:hypothetical protein